MEIIIRLIEAAAMFYIVMIAFTAFSTWIKPEIIAAYRPVFVFAAATAWPVISMCRRMFPVNVGRADFSPVIAIVFVEALKMIIIYLIKRLAGGLY